MAIVVGYQIQGINRDVNIAVKAIRGSISRPAQLVVGEYITWHVWTANVENALVLIWPHEGYGACFRYYVEGRYRDEIDWVDENADYDVLTEIIPLQNDPSAYGSIMILLEFDDNIGTPQTTDWKCFYNVQIKRHGSNSWEYVSKDLFYWKEWKHPELNNVHSEVFSEHKFWQRKELK